MSLRAMSFLLVGSFLVMPGCQTFKSTFTSIPKLPNASDLAFWKKDSDTVPPPPPAQHLNPSSTKGLSELANLGERNGVDIDQYRSKIDQMKGSIAALESQRDSQMGSQKPLRTPYGDTFKSDVQTAGNQIDKGFAAAAEKATGFGSQAKSSATNTLSEAQNRFNAAISDVKKPLEGDNGFRAPKDLFSTKPANDFKKALADTGSQFKTGIQSGINSAKKNMAFDEKVGQVNKSLYDMHGNLTTDAKSASNTGSGSIGSTVEAARKRFGSALGTVSDKAIAAAKTSTEFGGDLKNKIVAAASEMQPPLRGNDNSFKPAFSKTLEQGANKARNLIGNAKKEVAGLGTGFDFPESAAPKPQAPEFKTAPTNRSTFAEDLAATKPATRTVATPQNATPQNESFGGGTFGGGTFDRTRVANVTPANIPQQETLTRPKGLDSSLTNAWNNGSRQTNLKAIKVGTGSSMPGNGLRTASTNSNDFAIGTANIPAAFDEGRNTTASFINDVDIPSKILSGSGSYAPGSVNKVR